ncbi:hypothetical protein C8R43DRAFT_501011 [Mycena crocata]|nr:hypothetical protein C8R43DRAFT_501011 [Mycena crocata]
MTRKRSADDIAEFEVQNTPIRRRRLTDSNEVTIVEVEPESESRSGDSNSGDDGDNGVEEIVVEEDGSETSTEDVSSSESACDTENESDDGIVILQPEKERALPDSYFDFDDDEPYLDPDDADSSDMRSDKFFDPSEFIKCDCGKPVRVSLLGEKAPKAYQELRCATQCE